MYTQFHSSKSIIPIFTCDFKLFDMDFSNINRGQTTGNTINTDKVNSITLAKLDYRFIGRIQVSGYLYNQYKSNTVENRYITHCPATNHIMIDNNKAIHEGIEVWFEGWVEYIKDLKVINDCLVRPIKEDNNDSK